MRAPCLSGASMPAVQRLAREACDNRNRPFAANPSASRTSTSPRTADCSASVQSRRFGGGRSGNLQPGDEKRAPAEAVAVLHGRDAVGESDPGRAKFESPDESESALGDADHGADGPCHARRALGQLPRRLRRDAARGVAAEKDAGRRHHEWIRSTAITSWPGGAGPSAASCWGRAAAASCWSTRTRTSPRGHLRLGRTPGHALLLRAARQQDHLRRIAAEDCESRLCHQVHAVRFGRGISNPRSDGMDAARSRDLAGAAPLSGPIVNRDAEALRGAAAPARLLFSAAILGEACRQAALHPRRLLKLLRLLAASGGAGALLANLAVAHQRAMARPAAPGGGGPSTFTPTGRQPRRPWR